MSVSIRLKHSSTAAKVPLATDLVNGELALNTNSADPAIYLKDSAGAIRRVGGVQNASVLVSDTAPSSSADGDLWWNTNDGRLYIYYEDVDGDLQWVDASPDSQVTPVTSGPTFPAGALENDLFFNTTDGRLYIYYNDGTSIQWVDASPDNQAAVYWDRENSMLKPINDSDGVNIGDGKIELNAADGSASFAGEVTGQMLRTNAAGGQITANYNVVTEGQSGTLGLFIGCLDSSNASTANSNASITGDGSASFAGNIQQGLETLSNPGNLIYASGGYYSRFMDGNGTALQVKNSTTDAVLIKSDGSATFAGDVISGPYDATSAGGKGINLSIGNTAATLNIQAPDTASPSSENFRLYRGTSPTIIFKSEGSATFSSSLNAALLGVDRNISSSSTTLTVADRGTRGLQVFGNGTTQIGGTLTGVLASDTPNISLNADGQYRNIAPAGKMSFQTANATTNWGFGTQIASTAFFVQNSGGVGVVLPNNATAWNPRTSDSKLKKDFQPADTQQCWDLIKGIELEYYQYIAGDDVTIPYFGPMADKLAAQDPDLLITQDDESITYNQGLLDMKALQALSTALTRIEALEAEVQSLKGTSTADV